MKSLIVFFLLGQLFLVESAVIPENSNGDLLKNGDLIQPKDGGAAAPDTTYCYEYVGCFSNSVPFNNSGNFLPVSPDIINTEFLLFTPKNRNNEQLLSYKDPQSIKNSNFDPNLPLKIIAHGFSNNKTSWWLSTLKDALLNNEQVNVIIAAWGDGAASPHYANASANTRVVGKEISLIVKNIRSIFFPSNPSKLNVHCIGHSLGAHICGYAGSASDVLFDRISALDPAGPFFEDSDPIVRVDPTDAKFVDVLHTNAGTLLSASFGLIMPTGHVDFYVNGGSFQPGCPGIGSLIGSLLQGSLDPSKDVGCSHNRAIRFYIDSIVSTCPYIAFKCDSKTSFDNGECLTCNNNKCSVLGYYSVNYKSRGTFHLSTKSDAPYCGYHHFFEMAINENTTKTAGELVINLNPATTDSKYSLTATDFEIKPGDYIRKMFVTDKDLYTVDTVELVFNKKPKSWFNFFENLPSQFTFNKVKLINIEVAETFSKCENNKQIEDKKAIQLKLDPKDC